MEPIRQHNFLLRSKSFLLTSALALTSANASATCEGTPLEIFDNIANELAITENQGLNEAVFADIATELALQNPTFSLLYPVAESDPQLYLAGQITDDNNATIYIAVNPSLDSSDYTFDDNTSQTLAAERINLSLTNFDTPFVITEFGGSLTTDGTTVDINYPLTVNDYVGGLTFTGSYGVWTILETDSSVSNIACITATSFDDTFNVNTNITGLIDGGGGENNINISATPIIDESSTAHWTVNNQEAGISISTINVGDLIVPSIEEVDISSITQFEQGGFTISQNFGTGYIVINTDGSVFQIEENLSENESSTGGGSFNFLLLFALSALQFSRKLLKPKD